MHIEQSPLTRTFNQFFNSEKTSGILILFCTLVSMPIANSIFGEQYLNFWRIELLGLSIEHWVNDGLMAVFFLFIGLELERALQRRAIKLQKSPAAIFRCSRRYCHSSSDPFCSECRHTNTDWHGHSHGDRHRVCTWHFGFAG